MEAIRIIPQPLPETEVKSIRDWLSHPGCRAYQQHLANKAAVLMSVAINAELVLDRLEDDQLQAANYDIKIAKLTAKGLVQANEIMDNVKADDYDFEKTDLKPRQITQPKYGSDNQRDESRISVQAGNPASPASTV